MLSAVKGTRPGEHKGGMWSSRKAQEGFPEEVTARAESYKQREPRALLRKRAGWASVKPKASLMARRKTVRDTGELEEAVGAPSSRLS